MYAIVGTVTITDYAKARELLQEQLPGMKQAPGYDSEDAANAMKAQMTPGTKLNEYVTIESTEVREVAGTA